MQFSRKKQSGDILNR